MIKFNDFLIARIKFSHFLLVRIILQYRKFSIYNFGLAYIILVWNIAVIQKIQEFVEIWNPFGLEWA